MEPAVFICARLLRETAVARADLPDLDLPEVRAEVERRLGAVGLTLATSAYSEHVGLRLTGDVASHVMFGTASNLGLRADHCALLVILWARLVLQKRTASDERRVPGQQPLLERERAEAARGYRPSVRLRTLAHEFGKELGSRRRIKGLVSRLAHLGFLSVRGEEITPGPLLELGVDGERMVGFIRRGVLAQILGQERAAEPTPPEEDPAERAIMEALASLGGRGSIADLERVTGIRRAELRPHLRILIDEERVVPQGERFDRVYALPTEPAAR